MLTSIASRSSNVTRSSSAVIASYLPTIARIDRCEEIQLPPEHRCLQLQIDESRQVRATLLRRDAGVQQPVEPCKVRMASARLLHRLGGVDGIVTVARARPR